MKKLGLILIILLSFLSCTDYVDVLMKIEGITDPVKAWEWVSDNIAYVEDKPVMFSYSDWQPAEETLRLRTGDCDDFCILLGEMWYRLGYESPMVFIFTDEVHAVLFFYGVLIEPQIFNGFYLQAVVIIDCIYPYEDYRLLSQMSYARRE